MSSAVRQAMFPGSIGASVRDTSARPYAQLIMLAVIWFNFLLCFVNARHWLAVSASYVVATQVVLLGAACVVGSIWVTRSLLAYVITITSAAIALKIINPDLDLKILFDLAVAPGFILLGMKSSAEDATKVLRNVLICVVLVGFVEMAFSNWFADIMDIWGYYVSKGTVSANAVNFTGTTFFVSGERSEQAGRTLLPGILGPHRASSLFLEPVSMGNFPIICLAWLLSVHIPRRGLRIALFAMTFACIVLPDSRFASACCILMVAFRLSGLHRSAILAASLPFLVAFALWLVGNVGLLPEEFPRLLSDDLGGRLLFSGKLLAFWNLPNWLAFSISPVYVEDTGYAYLISNISLPIAALIWIAFAFAPSFSPEAASMRGMIAIYYASSLAINSSVFSIKTAALLWFLYGAAQAIGLARPRQGVRDRYSGFRRVPGLAARGSS